MHRHDVQTIVKIFAELTLRNQSFEILIGRRDDAYIEANARLAADAADRAALQRSQQARLRMIRHVANFIEEQRSALCLFEPTNSLPDRAGERAFFVTEKLGLDEF